MAMIAIPISDDVGRLFRQVDVLGERDPSDHMTMFHLGEDIKLDQILLATRAIYRVTSKMEPFTVSCKRITTFPKVDKMYPVIAKVDSKGLLPLRKSIESELKRSGVRYDKTHEDYNPHVTLGYSKKKPKNITFPKIEWQVNSVCLYGGDVHDERLFVSFPFSLGISKKAGYISTLANLYENLSKQ
jgi:2'-5' RNA ligase